MPIALTLTAAATSVSGGPFPPNYLVGANGYIAAGSNPTGDSAGALSANSYFGATILAIANDAAGSAATQLIVTLLGTWDPAFLSSIETPDTTVYESTNATSVQNLINGIPVTQWIWLRTGAPLTTGTVTLGDTGDALLTLTGDAPSSTEIDTQWVNTGPSDPASYKLYRGVGSASPTLYQTLSGTTLLYSDTGLMANTLYTYYIVATYANGGILTSEPQQIYTPASGISETFNCNCESTPLPADGWTIDSLANLRRRVLLRCGYAAQAANPPPGMAAFINELLREAQNQLYRQHSEFRNKRLYAWQMEPNVRYYGIHNDESNCRKFDPLSVDWAGFEDLNQAWYPLIEGIDPVLYTRAQISTGWPTHYEIRSCIEIFPAPRAPYTLWIKGRFGLDRFTEDTDNTTIDCEPVFLLACGFLKAHYGQADSQALLTQALNYTKYLVAAQHGTRRFVPRTRVQTPMTPPRFLPVEE